MKALAEGLWPRITHAFSLALHHWPSAHILAYHVVRHTLE